MYLVQIFFLCVPKVFLTSGELATDEIMIESDVGLIRLIVLAALSSSALNGQKILCGHSCVLKHRTRESRTGMQQALGVAVGSECFPGGVRMGTALANSRFHHCSGWHALPSSRDVGSVHLGSQLAFWAIKGSQSQGKLSFASSTRQQEIGNSIQETILYSKKGCGGKAVRPTDLRERH